MRRYKERSPAGGFEWQEAICFVNFLQLNTSIPILRREAGMI